MNPPSSRDETTPPEHYMPQSSSSSSSSAAAAAGGGRGGSLYLDAYEVSFPLEESIERPPAYHINQGQQMMDEPVAPELPHSQYSPFILVSNLRAHLYVALEKNAWLQKRIEELEEERNFLRCQLDRFIVSMRTPEGLCSCSSTVLLLWPHHPCTQDYHSPDSSRLWFPDGGTSSERRRLSLCSRI